MSSTGSSLLDIFAMQKPYHRDKERVVLAVLYWDRFIGKENEFCSSTDKISFWTVLIYTFLIWKLLIFFLLPMWAIRESYTKSSSVHAWDIRHVGLTRGPRLRREQHNSTLWCFCLCTCHEMIGTSRASLSSSSKFSPNLAQIMYFFYFIHHF